MKRFKEINLEDGKPTVSDALIILKSSMQMPRVEMLGVCTLSTVMAVAERAKL